MNGAHILVSCASVDATTPNPHLCHRNFETSNNSIVPVGCTIVLNPGLSYKRRKVSIQTFYVVANSLSWEDAKDKVSKVLPMHTIFISRRWINICVNLLDEEKLRSWTNERVNATYIGRTWRYDVFWNLYHLGRLLQISSHIGLDWPSHDSTIPLFVTGPSMESFRTHPTTWCNWMQSDTTLELITYLVQ